MQAWSPKPGSSNARDPRYTADESGTQTNYDEPIFDQGHMANDADLKDDVI